MIHTARLARAAVSPPVRRRTRHVHAIDRRTSDAQQAARAGHSTYSTIGEGVIGKVDHRKKAVDVWRGCDSVRHARAVLAARDHLHTHDRWREPRSLGEVGSLGEVCSLGKVKSVAREPTTRAIRST